MRLLVLFFVLFSTRLFAQNFEIIISDEPRPKGYDDCKKSNRVIDHEKNEVEIYRGFIEGESGQFYGIYYFFGIDTTVYQGSIHYGSERHYKKAKVIWEKDTLLNVTFINSDTSESIVLFGERTGKFGAIVSDK